MFSGFLVHGGEADSRHVCAITQKLVPAAPGSWCLGTVGIRAGREKRRAMEVDLEGR
jgi:hypothetical protein